MSVLEIVLLAVVGELGLGVAIGKFLRGPRVEVVPVTRPRRYEAYRPVDVAPPTGARLS